jgi:hypothetical protein
MTGIFVASALLVAVALLALMVHRRGGRARVTGPEAPGASLVTTRGASPTYAVGPGPGDVVLVPFPNDTGQALVVGPEDALAIFDRSGLTSRDTSAASGLVPHLVRDAMAAGGLCATDQFQQGANSGRIVAAGGRPDAAPHASTDLRPTSPATTGPSSVVVRALEPKCLADGIFQP